MSARDSILSSRAAGLGARVCSRAGAPRALPRLARVSLLLLLLLVGSTGCAGVLVARAPVLYPARLPVRAFPTLLVAGNALPEGDLAERLRAHLAKSGRHDVKRVQVEELEKLREAGAIEQTSLVIVVVPGLYSDVQDDYQMVPVQSCDFYYGCYTQYQNVYTETPTLVGEATVTVYEGPTARTLQKATFDTVVYGPDGPSARKQALDQLGVQLERAVDVLQSETRVELEPVDEHPLVKEALRLIVAGDWPAGRALLEQAAQALGGTKRSLQARVWYDLALARWYAPGPDGLTEQAYKAVDRALALAIRLDGNQRYNRTLERLARARQREKILQEQRAAARLNYALRDATPAPQ